MKIKAPHPEPQTIFFNYKKLFFSTLLFALCSFQIEAQEKKYDKDVALYRAKGFIAKDILGLEDNYGKFFIDPLAAASSGELTSVYFQSFDKDIKGLVLGFYDSFWVEKPDSKFRSYNFKYIEYDKAKKMLNKIESIIEKEKKFLNANDDENNIYFTFDDLLIIIYRKGVLSGRIRVFWGEFDAEWENTAFRRTKRRLEKSSS